MAVVGAGICGEELLELAEDVGRRLAEVGAVVLCGGLGGVMEGVARGADSAGGTVVGLLPGADPDDANPHITIPLATGMGEGRNVLIARAADAVIAIGGEWGTLSEVAFARKVGVPVVLLRPALAAALDLPVAETGEEAVERALKECGRTA